ncbi:hypothetical protein AVEN_26096-1 [Araneus ventricosus]|uniref:Tc1-like transposase DDE domain-containing protein n=1 Tax=Araneus ventricosus TaxID=182803 RepID=A0A4Y2EL00_ARAVE|nr:hypothetical protein AVEN_26096-1 [Araneus ventricosus]
MPLADCEAWGWLHYAWGWLHYAWGWLHYAWGAISWRGLGPLVILHGRIKSNHYLSILEDHVHPFVQTVFPGERPLFQDDNAPIHTARCVQE